MVQEAESSESLFSLSIDSRKVNPTPEMGDKEEEVSSTPLRLGGAVGLNRSVRVDRSQSVLNPIENLSQWKAIVTTPSKKNQENKENIDTNLITYSVEEDEQQSTKQTNYKLKNEMAVDTSLSSWLLVAPEYSQDTPNSKNSSASVGNTSPPEKPKSPRRPILGALTIAEALKDSATPSSPPERSPSCRLSPDDDNPIIVLGTVGSYWRHTGRQPTVSDSASYPRGISSSKHHSQQDRNNTHSTTTPFLARLEESIA